MKGYIVLSVVCLHLGWTYGIPAGTGVASYAYQDSSGNRYGGTFDLDDAQVYPSKGKSKGGSRDWDNYANAQVFTNNGNNGGGWGAFAPWEQSFQEYEFIPEYFNNLQNLLNEVFHSNVENQKLAFNAAKKAFDLTSNQAGYNQNFPTRFNNFDFDGLQPGFAMPLGAPNSAFAGAAAGPGFTHQIAALNPENPLEPNIDIKNRFSDTTGGGGGFYGVSSSSYSSSANVNGQQISHKGAETLVNNNGVVTRYRVQN